MPALVIGVLASEGVARELAGEVADKLADDLAEAHPDVDWRTVAAEEEPADAASDSRELVEAVRRRLLSEGWDLAVGLTQLPLHAGRRPVSAHASATHGVGLVSVPALGALSLRRRLRKALVHVVEGLLGERDGHSSRLPSRLAELTSPLGRAREADGTIRFVGATLRGNVRLLTGMVRANQPARVIARLAGALAAALGTAAIAVASSNVWELGDAMTWPRLVGLTLLSIGATSLALVLAHGLWERAPNARARERVVLFNLATVGTVVIGVAALYASLLATTTAGAAALVPPGLFADTVHHGVGVLDYVQLGWLVATMATIGSALGCDV